MQSFIGIVLRHRAALFALVVASATLDLPPAARAQVGPATFSFEIDGDYGDILQDLYGGDGAGYLPAADVTLLDGLHSWGRRQTPCDNWVHTTFTPYMGPQSYRCHCEGVGTQRRTEQMILSNWIPNAADSQRYFSLAFRLTDVPQAPVVGTRGFLGQLHQGSSDPVPFRFQWEYLCPPDSAECGYYVTMGLRHGAGGTFVEIGSALGGGRRGFAVAHDVWYRMLFRISLVPDPSHSPCPGTGEIQAWLMDNASGLWEEVAYYAGPLGSPTGTCSCQWKVGIYANNQDLVTIDYDNVAYGKRWSNITKNSLIGSHKTVLDLWCDEGSGSLVGDHSYWWNGGSPGDPAADYDNDGTFVGTPLWNTGGIAHGGSLRLSGSNYVTVPMDDVDFDFGNYVTAACWFRTTSHPADNRGLLVIDEFSSTYKVKLHFSDTNLSFGVRHVDGNHASLNYGYAPGTYSDGEWHQALGIFNRFAPDGQRLKLYVDGELVLQIPGTDLPLLLGEDRLVVGKYGSTGLFVGDIDEVLIRNYAMTDQEVDDLYAFYVPTAAGPAPPAASLPIPVSVTPNPSRAETTLRFTAPGAGRATLTLFDATGAVVARPFDGEVGAGVNEARWDGRDRAGLPQPSGVYYYRLECGARTESGPIVLVR